jgi:hypothetical protein
MKSVSNRIFNLHDFYGFFSQLLAICFVLFSSGSIFNSKNRCRGVPPVSLSLSASGPLISAPSPRGCHVPTPVSAPRRHFSLRFTVVLTSLPSPRAPVANRLTALLHPPRRSPSRHIAANHTTVYPVHASTI